jgi:hypothetical protein
MTTMPERARCSTSRWATISDMISSALWTRLRRETQPEGEGICEVGVISWD